jgi:hypothetical protein
MNGYFLLYKLKMQIIVYVCTFGLLMGCGSEYGESSPETNDAHVKSSLSDLLPDTEAGNIVKNSIERSGGWENWSSKRSLSYTKIMQFFDSTGVMQRELRQLHQYQLRPQLKMRITWEESGDKYAIINNGRQAWKFKNGQELTGQSDIGQAWNSSFGSHYVMCMPFKLTDPGAVLTYEGLDTLPAGEEVYSIKTTYKEGAGSSAGMHTWWYYFDKEDYSPVANFLDYGNGFSYTHYEEFSKKDGVSLNKKRKSYSASANRDLNYLSSVYINEGVEFDVPLAKSLFTPPQ